MEGRWLLDSQWPVGPSLYSIGVGSMATHILLPHTLSGYHHTHKMSLSLRLPPAAAFWHSQWRWTCNKSRHICLSAPSSPTICSTPASLPVLVDDGFIGYISGQNKATDVAHSVWKRVVRKGDSVVDATCGNGHDTLAMIQMVEDNSSRGRVYSMDIQEDALRATSYLLEQSLSPKEMELVRLFPLCHSRMEEVIPAYASVRLVAFNLGYLPGGDKSIITKAGTTLLALEAAGRLVESGGLISVVVYVGHPGGREEYDTVREFSSGLSTDDWICCELQMLNRPLAPILVFMNKR